MQALYLTLIMFSGVDDGWMDGWWMMWSMSSSDHLRWYGWYLFGLAQTMRKPVSYVVIKCLAMPTPRGPGRTGRCIKYRLYYYFQSFFYPNFFSFNMLSFPGKNSCFTGQTSKCLALAPPALKIFTTTPIIRCLSGIDRPRR